MRVGVSVALTVFLVPVMAGCLEGAHLRPPNEYRYSYGELLVWSWPADLVVEIDYMPGYEPEASTIELVRDALETYTNKRTITILDPEEIEGVDPTPSTRWTGVDVWAVHEEHQVVEYNERGVHDGTMYLHWLALDRDFEYGDGIAVGVQINPMIVMFPDRERTALFSTGLDGPLAGGPHPEPEAGVASTTMHELGHALGLVGREAPLLHPERKTSKDTGDDCACHSRNGNSVMRQGTESFNATRYVMEGRWAQTDFDAHDIEEIAALRALDPFSP